METRIRLAAATVAVLIGLATPLPALAAGGGGDSGALALVVVLIAVVGVAYLLTHFVADWLQKLFLIATSIEYLVLGLLLGLVLVPNEASREVVDSVISSPALSWLPWPEPLDSLALLAPLIALAAGWIGLLHGMTVDVRQLLSRRDGALRLALLEGVLTALPVGYVAYVVLGYFLPEGHQNPGALALCAGVLGVTAWAGSTSAMELVRRRYNVAGDTLLALVRGARLSDTFAILAFGVLFATFHGLATPNLVDAAPVSRMPTPVEWSVITLGLGAGLGALFAWYLDEDDSDGGTLLALVGIIAFASGASYFLDLSALTINMVLGMVLVTASRSGPKVRRTLQGTTKPMNLLLILLAGALWDPPPLVLTLVLTGAIISVRALGKVVAGWLASIGTELRADVFRGIIGQGEVSIAMAVSFKLVYDVAMPASAASNAVDGAIDATYTAILIGVVVHEIFAPRILKGLLVDAGEIQSEAAVGG